tara:strand:+ start:302 stop:442 length:141 start_codon:yes stop_codon:yes gene_type:complete
MNFIHPKEVLILICNGIYKLPLGNPKGGVQVLKKVLAKWAMMAVED